MSNAIVIGQLEGDVHVERTTEHKAAAMRKAFVTRWKVQLLPSINGVSNSDTVLSETTSV